MARPVATELPDKFSSLAFLILLVPFAPQIDSAQFVVLLDRHYEDDSNSNLTTVKQLAESRFNEKIAAKYPTVSIELMKTSELQLMEPVIAKLEDNLLTVIRSQFCDRILNNTVAVIYAGSERTLNDAEHNKFLSTLSSTLALYRIPVVSLYSRDVSFADTFAFSTLLRLAPTWTQQADIWIELLKYFNFEKVVVIYTDDADSHALIQRFRQLAENYSIEIETEVAVEKGGDYAHYDAALDEVVDASSNVFLLHVSLESNVSSIIKVAESRGLIAEGKAWFITEPVLASLKAEWHGFISTRLRRPTSRDSAVSSSFSEAFTLVRAGLDSFEVSDDSSPKEDEIIDKCKEADNQTSDEETSSLVMELLEAEEEAHCSFNSSAKNETTSVERRRNSLLDCEYYLQGCRDTIAAPHDRQKCIRHEDDESLGQHFYEALLKTSAQSRILFSNDGDRLNAVYDIINGPNRIVGNYTGGRSASELLLDESLILWPGNVRQKPATFALPSHLKAAVVEDQPFVYKFGPVNATSQCRDKSSRNLNKRVKCDEIPKAHIYACVDRHAGIVYCCCGYAVDLLHYIASNTPVVNFTFELDIEEKYGSYERNDGNRSKGGFRWTGVIKRLSESNRDERGIDLAIGAFTINEERQKVIDFSKPWLYHGIQLLEKKMQRRSPMHSFMQPFNPSVWLCILFCVLTVGVALYIVDKKSPFAKYYVKSSTFDLRAVDEDDEPLNFSGALWFVWGVLLDSGIGERSPRSCSGRVLAVVWCGFSMIMVASYTANLAAFLVLDRPTRQLSGVNDPRLRNPSTNFTYATVAESNTFMYFKRHVELSTMFRKMRPLNYKNADEAIEDVRIGKLNAFIHDSVRLEHATSSSADCDLRVSGSIFGRSAYGVGLKKNSPWTRLITQAILQLTEGGTMEMLDMRWIGREGANCSSKPSAESPVQLGLTNTRDLFYLVALGVLSGLVLITVEISVRRYQLAGQAKRRRALLVGRQWKTLTASRQAERSRSHESDGVVRPPSVESQPLVHSMPPPYDYSGTVPAIQDAAEQQQRNLRSSGRRRREVLV